MMEEEIGEYRSWKFTISNKLDELATDNNFLSFVTFPCTFWSPVLFQLYLIFKTNIVVYHMPCIQYVVLFRFRFFSQKYVTDRKYLSLQRIRFPNIVVQENSLMS